MIQLIKEYLLTKIVFWVCLSISLILIILGFFLPPLGNIDPSVLTAVGEIFAFATLAVVWESIREGLSAKLTKGDITLEVSQENKKGE